MNRRTVSTGVGALVLVSAVLGGVLAFTGSAAAAGGPCNIVLSGENLAHNALQSAINLATAGQTICVRAGTYPEQVTISTPGLHIVGAGAGRTIIAPSTGVVNTVDWDSAPSFSSPPSSLYPVIGVVVVANVSGVVLKGVTVDAAGAAASIGGCSPGIVGVDFQNAHTGKLIDSQVENTILSPSLLGCQFQLGVYAYTGYYETGVVATGATITIRGTSVSAYGKGGIVCDDPGLTCRVRSDSVVGIGPTPAIGQNGIQVAYGAVGLLTGDTVSANVYDGSNGDYATPADDNDFFGNGTAVGGILLYQAGAGTKVVDCTLSQNQVGIFAVQDPQDTFRGNTITNSVAYGIGDYGLPTSVTHIAGNFIANPSTGAIGVIVVNGTFYVTHNTIKYSLNTGDQGASQAVTGAGTYYPLAAPASIATAGVQAVSDGNPTHVYLFNNAESFVSLHISTVAVFGGTVTVTT